VVFDDLAPAPPAAGAVLDEFGELDGLGADIDSEETVPVNGRRRAGLVLVHAAETMQRLITAARSLPAFGQVSLVDKFDASH
jgi:hypothetical protein